MVPRIPSPPPNYGFPNRGAARSVLSSMATAVLSAVLLVVLVGSSTAVKAVEPPPGNSASIGEGAALEELEQDDEELLEHDEELLEYHDDEELEFSEDEFTEDVTTTTSRERTTTTIRERTTTTVRERTTTTVRSGEATEAAPEASCILSGHVAGVTVAHGETCEIVGEVISTGNVIVRGRLVMRPGSTLSFSGVDSSRFVGGGMVPIASDVGLWVMDDGVLDAIGTPVKAWNRTGTDPSWRSDHELKVAPTSVGDYTFSNYGLGSPVPRFSATVPAAEVINLTRDVVIRSINGGKAHVFIHSRQPQTIKYVTIQAMGPADQYGADIIGRYSLHFHHMGDDSRGSLVEGVVVRDSDSHAFVPHASHGITFRETIAYRTKGGAYWWDPMDKEIQTLNSSHDIVYERAGAGEIAPLGGPRGVERTWGAFQLHAGTGGRVVDSWAAGVSGPTDAAGFAWPGHEEQSWHFTGNVAHNNHKNGIWVWQNKNSFNHHIDNFVGYANAVGVDHGAYSNRFRYSNVRLEGNTQAGLELHSFIATPSQAYWDNWTIIGSSTSVLVRSTASTDRTHPVIFSNCNFSGMIERRDNRPDETRLVQPYGGC